MSAKKTEADALIGTLLSQMTEFSCLGCPQQALDIRRQLARLQRYPDSEVAPSLKQLGKHLEQEWTQLHFAIADDLSPDTGDQLAVFH